jgi:putative ABC transport system permease protein
MNPVDSVLQDLRYAVRRLWASPGLTLAVSFTLAIGICGTAATFSVVDAAILRPLPFADPASVVRVREVTPEGQPFSVSEPDYLDLAQRLHTISSIAAMKPLQATLTGAGDATRVEAAAVTATLFPMLGVSPVGGRLFTNDDEHPGSASVAIVSEALWRRRLHGDPGAVGRTIVLDGSPVAIVGILPNRGVVPAVDVWVPLAPSMARDRTDKWLDVVARVKPGYSVAAVTEDAATVIGELAAEHPELRMWSAQAETIDDWLIGPGVRRTMWVLAGAVVALLALACANIAGLLMSRMPVRRFEMGIRGALGAGRARLIRQLLTEHLLLAVVGGAIGLLGAEWTVTGLSALLSGVLPLGRVAQIDGRVVGVTALIVCVATLLFGTVPAFHAAPAEVASTLRSGGRGTTRRSRRWSNGLVTVQVALAMVLLAGSFLLIGSLARLSLVDPGFHARGVLTVPLSLAAPRYSDERRIVFFDALGDRLAATPGVEAVGATATNPFREWGFANDVTPEERKADAPPSGLMQAGWRSVTPGFFDALEIPVIAGRTFTPADRDGREPVAVISRGLADRLWPRETAVGRRFYWGGLDGSPRTVVGVVGDVRDTRLDSPPTPLVYLPYAQVPMEGMTLLVRARAGTPGLSEAIRQAVRTLDPSLPADEIESLDANRQRAVSAPRFRVVMLGTFGAVALALAALGLYGTVAFTVAQRSREIAIRVALGAPPAQIVRLFFRDGAALAVAGTAAGLAIAWGAAGILRALLFETPARDPRAFLPAAALLVGVAVLASYVPARRATRVDPIATLTRD